MIRAAAFAAMLAGCAPAWALLLVPMAGLAIIRRMRT